MARVLLLCLLALCCAASTTAPAHAVVTTKKSIWGPVERDGADQFPIYAELGAGYWHTAVNWSDLAPSRPANPRDPADPAYVWPAYIDDAVQRGARHGIKVSIMLIGAPEWANGGRDWRWAPKDPGDFADFAEAASRRYPAVRHWMIWGEPTKPENFQPLASDRGRPLRTSTQRRGPRLYARILDAAYGALKRVRRSNVVIGGNTYTVGAIRPLHFIPELKLPNGRPPRMDMWGHNPFTLRRPNLRATPLNNGYADFCDLDELTRVLDRAMRRAKTSRQRRLQLWLSEYSLPTDRPNHEFNFWLDDATQADWLGAALRITRGWKRIHTLGYLSLYDDPLREGNDQVERGLIRRDGSRKPAYETFRRG
jgi:hypothetical protein